MRSIGSTLGSLLNLNPVFIVVVVVLVVELSKAVKLANKNANEQHWLVWVGTELNWVESNWFEWRTKEPPKLADYDDSVVVLHNNCNHQYNYHYGCVKRELQRSIERNASLYPVMRSVATIGRKQWPVLDFTCSVRVHTSLTPNKLLLALSKPQEFEQKERKRSGEVETEKAQISLCLWLFPFRSAPQLAFLFIKQPFWPFFIHSFLPSSLVSVTGRVLN